MPERRLWFREVDIVHKGSKTGKEYTRYNNGFQKWFDFNYGKQEITESHAREYVGTYIAGGKSTQVLIAALSFRFGDCEKR